MAEEAVAPPQHYCEVWDCRKRTDNRCVKCQRAFYCSKAHQNDAWPHHKLVCKEMATVVDGDALCTLILKTMEDLSPALDGLGFVHTDISDDKRLITIRLHRETAQERAVVNCVEKFCAEEPSELARLSYWALRCQADGFTLNYTLWSLLCDYRRAGYTDVQFDKRRLSLAQEPRLDMLHLKPDRVVTRQIDDDPETVLGIGAMDGGQFHFVPTLDRHALDLAVGQFWVFDQALRPCIVVLQKELYLDTVGGLLSECAHKRVASLAKVLEKNQRVTTLRALLSVTLDVVRVVEIDDDAEAKQ